jgi:HD-like signal output (HDOD) protein
MSASSDDKASSGQAVRILFVDDDADVLDLMRMVMLHLGDTWAADFAPSGEAALAFVRQQSYDVVVSDMKMPGMSGAQLLAEVMQIQPRALRIILSGYLEESTFRGCAAVAHQCLPKPIRLTDLEAILSRIRDLNAQVESPQLRTLVARLTCPPSLPPLYLELVNAALSPMSSLQEITDIVCRDPALTAKMLQLANSAFIGVGHPVSHVFEAVQLLGVDLIQSLALAVPLFSAFDSRKCPVFPLEEVWQHSLETGLLARRMIEQHALQSLEMQSCFTAGLLHDLGKLILADGLPGEYTKVMATARAQRRPIHEVEKAHWQVSHADIGGYLLGLWGLPVSVVEAVMYHHAPSRDTAPHFGLLTVVHVADVLQHEQPTGDSFAPARLDMDYLARVGVADEVVQWRSDMHKH